MSEQSIDQQWWEDYFAVDGGWERNGGRDQSRIFAEHCSRYIKLNSNASFTLLDMGCALGDALRHFARAYPRATLIGADFSATAIRRCQSDLCGIATFIVCDIDSLSGSYDVIYVSNVMEHFRDYRDKARKLLRHARRLWMLMPFNELRDGQLLSPDPTQHHQHTFRRDSFNFLVEEGLASQIESYVFPCYGAWPAKGASAGRRVSFAFRNLSRRLRGKAILTPELQILFDVK